MARSGTRKAVATTGAALSPPHRILEHLRDAFLLVDAHSRCIYANREAERMLGSSRAEVIGRPLLDLSPSLAGTPLDSACRQAMAGRFAAPYEGQGPSGRWYDIAVYPTGEGALIQCRDITERKQAEDALRQSEERYRRLIETCYEGVWTIDAEGRTDFVNRRAAEMMGYTVEEMLGQSPLRYVPPEDTSVAEAHIVQHREGRGTSLIAPMRRKDGSDIMTRLSTSPIFGAEGRYLGALAMFTDISDQVRAEQDRLQLLRRLLTALEDERRRIARELHDRMGQTIAAMALELKGLETSLPVGSTHVDRLRPLRSLCADLGRDVHRVARELRPAALDDLGLCEALRAHLDEWAARSGIALEIEFGGLPGGRLPSDLETTVYRVVQEALTNVARHSQARRASVVLRGSGGRLVCLVADDGDGFDTDSVLGPLGAHDAIGLAGARERAQLVGGSLTVESAPGQGTTVRLEIPVPGWGEGHHA